MQHDITDINDIFRDLGSMVNDQGEMIGKRKCVLVYVAVLKPCNAVQTILR